MSSGRVDNTATKLCIACSKWVALDETTCTCGHVFKQVKSINGKRFTEGRFYQEVDDSIIEPKKRQRGTTSIFCREKITYMPGFSYEEIEDIPEKRERKRKKRRPIHMLSTAANYRKATKGNRNLDSSIANGVFRKEPSNKPIEQPLINVLQEINNKITIQRRLWIDLDS